MSDSPDRTRSYKAPPAYKEGECYDDWKLDVEIWKEFTSLPKNKRGPALLLELKEGKVKNAVRSLGKTVITGEDGLEHIIEHLDKIYKEDVAHLSYRTYCKFEKYQRPESMNLQSYISEFEKMISDLRKCNINLPEEVLAYRVLNSANLSPEKVDLALATVKTLTYKDMCATIGKIFSVQLNMTPLDTIASGSTVKQESEECNYTSHSNWRGQSFANRPARGQFRGKFRGNYHPYSRGNNRNCFNCSKFGHLARDCKAPRKSNDNVRVNYVAESTDNEPEDTMEVSDAYITLMVNKCDRPLNKESSGECLINTQPDLSFLVYETLACAVIDSGCTKTVVGRSWADHYLETLDDKERKIMTSVEACNIPFRFGDGKEILSKEKIKIPGCIGTHKILFEANVVDCEIPLLLSKASLKKAGAVIDFVNDRMEFNGESIALLECKSGHYCVPICNKKKMVSRNEDDGSKLVLTVTEATLLGTNNKEMKEKALKLHRQFSHAPAYKLKSLLTNAGFQKKEYFSALDEVCESCDICKRYKKAKPRPVVGLPRSQNFNDTVAMDLKGVNNEVLLLHMIDTFTRFSSAKIVPSKRQETIVSAICSGWISLFGSPKRFMADNGGEFVNKEYTEMCEQFNIQIQNSAAESPFSNGMVERHHQVLTEMLIKTKEDCKCSYKIALCWALNAKNSMQMNGGYSSYQLLLGKNPSLPNVIDNELPAMEKTSISAVLEKNLQAMRKAREEFVKAESSNKIKRALRSQVRTCNYVYLDNGTKVYFKRNNVDRWHGPGLVIGRDSQCLIIKHANQIVRVHPRDILQAGVNTAESPPEPDPLPQPPSNNYLEVDCPQTERSKPEDKGETAVSSDLSVTTPLNKDIQSQQKSIPKPKMAVLFLPKYPEGDDDRWEKAYIHSRGGKATGKYANCLNIQLEGEEEIKCVDWTEVAADWKEDTEKEHGEEILLASTTVAAFEQDVVDVKMAELDKLRINNVYEEVRDLDQPTVGVRWVLTKNSNTGKPKARLVALGYQENSTGIRKDSPTCNKDTVRILLMLSSTKNWKIRHIDVQSAFLQGKDITRDVFLKPPVEAETAYLWKLKKCIYGLADGPRMWYVELRDTLVKLGTKVSVYDESFTYFHFEGALAGIMAVHVDDLIFSGNDIFEMKVIEGLKQKFKLSVEAETSLVYTGLEIKQASSFISLSQLNYINQISEIKIDQARIRHNDIGINDAERVQLRSVCGQLLWVATQSRPDVSYANCIASNAITSGKISDLKLVNKTVKYLKANPLVLRFSAIDDLSNAVIVVFCDASYGNLRNGASQGGHLILMVSRQGKCAPLTWQSRKIRRICKSTLAAESWALVEAVECADFISKQLSETVYNNSQGFKIVCLTDCKSLYDAVHTTNNLDDKGLRIPVACLRQRVEFDEIIVHWIGTKMQLADSLTKAGASSSLLSLVLSSGKLPNDIINLVFMD